MDLEILLLIGVVGIIIGGLINQLINNLVDRRESARSPTNREEILSLRRDSRSGQLLVSFLGKETDSSDNLDKEQREDAQRLIMELDHWLKPSAAPRPEPTPIPTEDRDKSETEEAEDSLSRPTLNPVTVLVRALQADVKKSQLPTESITSQINDILQEDLKNAPHIKDPVRLMEWPGLGMVVMVGLDKYNCVDDVPDEGIRAIIHGAVEKWEQRVLPDKK